MDTNDSTPDIVIVTDRIDSSELRRLVEAVFGDMVKYVVDLRREVVAVGGEMHVDAEGVLLDDGSRQDDLWGANYRPGRGVDECIQYESLINIRPVRGNRGMYVESAELRQRIRALTFERIGSGDPL